MKLRWKNKQYKDRERGLFFRCIEATTTKGYVARIIDIKKDGEPKKFLMVYNKVMPGEITATVSTKKAAIAECKRIIESDQLPVENILREGIDDLNETDLRELKETMEDLRVNQSEWFPVLSNIRPSGML